MAHRFPSLNALRAFECAARHSSLTLAASEMNVTHAAVSRHIRELEGWLGVELFIRTGRGVELTESGRAMARDLTGAFDQLAAAIAPYSPKRQSSQLVITSDVSFAACWLAPRLGQFSARHPGIEIILDPSPRLVDFKRNEADLGIRYGSGVWEDVQSLLLVRSRMSAVCSPGYLKANRVREPADLVSLPLIHEDVKPLWQDWLSAAGVSRKVTEGGRLVMGHLAIAAAEAGQGFALADALLACDALKAKRLVRPFDVYVGELGYHLVRRAGRAETKPMILFRVWLESEIKASLRTVPWER